MAVLAGKSEEMMQTVLVNWFERTYPEHSPWMHHSPNGGARDGRTGQKMKLLGARRGVPDLMLFVGMGEYVGLALELKAKGGRLSSDQARWLQHLKLQGWHTEVPYTLEQAQDCVNGYLGMKGQ